MGKETLNSRKNDQGSINLFLICSGLIIYNTSKRLLIKKLGLVLNGLGLINILSSYTINKNKVRLIFYGGSREKNLDGSINKIGVSDNSAFYFAAKNTIVGYKDFKFTGQLIKIKDSIQLVDKINSQNDGSIHTLDILSHGTPYSLNFSLIKNENCGLYSSKLAKKAVELYYTFSGFEWYVFSQFSRDLNAINYNKFAFDARIEIHGCNTANDLNLPLDTFVEKLSIYLYQSNKRHSVVIGHLTKATPNINGSSTQVKEQDYRHGLRGVFHNGDLLFTTNIKGVIAYSDIQKKLKEKLKNDY